MMMSQEKHTAFWLKKNVIADFFYYSALIVDNYLGLGFEVSK